MVAPVEYHLDLETRSKAALRKVGAHRYARDPSTRILMLAVADSAGNGPFLYFNPEFESPECISDPRAHQLLQKATADGALIWAHNAEFERSLNNARLQLDMGITPPKTEQYRCTAALARKVALPANLAGIGEALNLGQQKWGEGYQLIRKFSIPDSKTGQFRDPTSEEHAPAFRRFGEYCVQDVHSETSVYQALQTVILTGPALESFLMDARLNDRGVPVNVDALRKAQAIIDEVQAEVTTEFRKLTGLNPTQRDKVMGLLASYGIDMPNMQAATLDEALDDENDDFDWDVIDEQLALLGIEGNPRRVLELYKQVSYAAVKKVRTMLDCVCEDGRVRGCFVWHGATTGRWTAKLIQPQNFKRPTIKDTHLAYKMICEGCSRDDIELLWGKGRVLEVISSCIRHFIQLPGGQEMLDADFSAVEARIVCWLAEQEDALERFRKGIDSYVLMAKVIFGREKINSDERWVGKQTVLGCGFGMGKDKFYAQAFKLAKVMGITSLVVTEELAERAVSAFREQYDEVRRLWYAVDEAARAAINCPGTEFKVKRLTFKVRKIAGISFLLLTLPSGRNLFYPHPQIEEDNITFYGQIKGKTWGRVKTYGAKLVENAVQAIAGDFMSGGSVEAERVGIFPFALVHDQALAAKGPDHTPEMFCKALTVLPSWAHGMPLKADGKVVPYYLKL